MRKILCGVLAGTVAISMAACGGSGGSDKSGTAAKDQIKIGVANFGLQAPYFIAMSKAIQDEAKTYSNVKTDVTDAHSNASQLTTDVNNLLAQNVDGIIVSGGPLNAAPAAMNAIKKKKVPVILVDRKFSGGNYTSWVGPDNEQIGQEDGKFIVDKLHGKGTLAIIRGGPADNTIGLARTNGVKSAVKKAPGIKTVISPDFGQWSSDGGLKAMQNLLVKNKEIDAVFCENDAMCLGAKKAIGNAHRSDQMFLVAGDGQKEALKAIKSGSDYAATAVNNSDTIGRMGFDRLMAVLGGATPKKDTPLDAPLVTKQNVDQYYDPNSLF